jgi:hypothetical protein
MTGMPMEPMNDPRHRRQKKRVAVSIRKGRLYFVRIPPPETASAVLDELPAEAALDTEVPPGDVVVEG